MYLTDKYRPKEFDEVIGQNHIIKILKRIIKTPEEFPKNFIFNGPTGSGKTTCARIFAKKMVSCVTDSAEYDVSVIGNAESMEDIKSKIDNVYLFSKSRKVLIFNEMQEASKKAQSLLLETLEDNFDSNVYFIFTTTDISKVIDTIRGRCAYEFNFRLTSEEEMKPHLISIAEKESISINESDMNLVIKKSKGHMRNAVNLLDMYRIDPESFSEMINDTIELLKGYLFEGKDNLNTILVYPAQNLKEDLNVLISDYIQKEENLMFKMDFFKTYMMYKNYISGIEDVVAVLNILRKLFKTKRG